MKARFFVTVALALALAVPLSAQEKPAAPQRTGSQAVNTPPPGNVPPQFRGERSTDPTSLGDLGWWEVFKDPQLQRLIKTALERNFDLRIAIERVDTACANVGIVRSNASPQTSLTGNWTFTQESALNPDYFPGLVARTTSLGQVLLNLLSFEVDIWGRLRHQTLAARAQLAATVEDRKAVLTTVVSDVATAYFNLLALDAQLEVDRQTLDARQRSLDIIKTREEGGVATLLDVRQGEQLVEQAQMSIPDAERQIAQGENTLNLLLGNSPGPVVRGLPLTRQEGMPQVPAGLPSSLLLRRPDIREAEDTLTAQKELVSVARASFFPQITLTGYYGYQSSALVSLFTGAARGFSLVPQVSQPLINGGRLRSALELARGNQRIALLQYQQIIQTAFKEVSNALVEYQKTREARQVAETLVVTLTDRQRLAYLRYEGGVDTLLNALDADRDLFNAQLNLAILRRNELLSMVMLYKALGGGWQMPPPAVLNTP